MDNDRLISEKDLMEELGLKKGEVYKMRMMGLKTVRISRTRRLYFISDIHEFARKNVIELQNG